MPADHVREEVAVEGGIGGQHGMEVQHVLGRDELIQPDRPGWYLGPFPRGPGMFGVWPPVPDLLEDHAPSLEESGARRLISFGLPQGDSAGLTA